MAHLGGRRSPEQTSAYMKQNLAHWEQYGYGIWILRERATGCLVGRGGLRHLMLEGKNEVELAYGLMPDRDDDDRIRTKGAVDLSFYVDQGGAGRPGLPGETLHQGDRIRLAVEPGSHRYVLVVSVASNGEVIPLYPDGSGESVPVAAGERSLLEGSVILDDYRGEERLFALFSDHPLSAEQVVTAARQALQQQGESGRGVQDLHRLPVDASQATTWFRKE